MCIFCRWKAIWTLLEGSSQCVLDGLIREVPALFGVSFYRSLRQILGKYYNHYMLRRLHEAMFNIVK